MNYDKFNKKIICDNVHGSIGISELEQDIINTRTFQRLKKIKQLGLASWVFPGAEHSRFAHSIGVLHVMSKMIEKLEREGCAHFEIEENVQKLRLAALLHDIGHYPLSHVGEQVFNWVEYWKNRTGFFSKNNKEEYEFDRVLREASYKSPVDVADHERLGELILTSDGSEIKNILENSEYRFDPREIAQIFNAENRDYVFYTQLMSSTLDCDRMDFLLRDSLATGTSYGKVDFEYILRNMMYFEEQEGEIKNRYICFHQKAIHAIEHFIMGRYFAYNITYHKTVLGFELMAKALFFCMIIDKNFTPIVKSFDSIKNKIKNDQSFLANFTDEYFWHYLEIYNPTNELVKELKDKLLKRIPLRPIMECSSLQKRETIGGDKKFDFLVANLLDRESFKTEIEKIGLSLNQFTVLKKNIDFEEISYEKTDEELAKIKKKEKRLKLVRIKKENGMIDLINIPGSIISELSNYKHRIAKLYVHMDRNPDKENLLREIIDQEYLKCQNDLK